MASSTVVTARELNTIPTRSAEDALRLVPGVTLVQHGSEGKGYQFSMRGFDAVHGADLELTVEGLPINEWSNIHAQGYLDLGFVIPEAIESVSVTKGPFTLEQGAFAMAGSAAYHLGVSEDNQGLRAAYTLGSTNRQRGVITFSPRSGGGHDFIASETLHDAGFGQNRATSRGAVLGRTTLLNSQQHGELSALGAGSVARFGLPEPLRNEDVAAGRLGFYDSYEQVGRGTSLRTLGALLYEQVRGRRRTRASGFGAFRRLELLENFTGYLSDPVAGDRRDQRHEAASFGANLTHTQPLLETLDVELGFGARGDALAQAQSQVTQTGSFVARERSLEALQMLSHALAGIILQPLTKLRFDAGARFDLVHVRVRDRLDAAERDSATLQAVSPRLSAAFQVVPALRLVAAYGRGFRPPEARAFTSFEPAERGSTEELFTGGEPDITASDALELGALVRASRALSLRLSGFATFVARESVFDHVSGVNLELNATRRTGAELALRVTPTAWIELNADATYVDARFVDSGRPIPFAPELVGSARAALTHGGFSAGLRIFAIAPRALPHGAQGATLAQLDATTGYAWDAWRLELELENVLNHELREGEYHYASHWQRGQPASQLPVLHTFAGPPRNARLTLSAIF
jgi:outer membrane receptor protein involved in Fe transport